MLTSSPPKVLPELFFNDTRLYRHSGPHIAHSDLQEILHLHNWQLQAGQRWGLIGGSESQRSALLDVLREKITGANKTARATISTDSEMIKNPHSALRVAEISMLEQERLINEEQRRNQTGVADEVYAGIDVRELLAGVASAAQFAAFVEALGFSHCLDKHFRELSSGETRRLLLLRALLSEPDVLLLHDPYEGLDSATRPRAAALLQAAMQQPALQLAVFATSRAEYMPACCTHIASINSNTLDCIALDTGKTLQQFLDNWLRTQQQPAFDVPPLPADHPYHREKLPQNIAAKQAPLIAMNKVRVHYAGEAKPVLDQLDWTVMHGQHWRIAGANGSGKTTLLKLVTGDHPQVYNNDISVCGYRRGEGESIWQVKRHIGYMGGEMLWNHRGTAHMGKAIDVVISGLYDSIGLYTTPNAADRNAGAAWLALLGIEQGRQRFKQLDMAEQRLVLIARAMIKRPALLILDEPLQGLDANDRQRVLAIVSTLLEARAVTLLYVSHHDDEQVQGVEHTLEL
ncbi:MAG: ATP-binding cassette domain-containing protein [Pseudomonadales bacterium]